MAAPGTLTTTELVALTKQTLGGRNTGLMTDAWYVERLNSAYARLCTFQGQVNSPGMRRPVLRVLRFFELYTRTDTTIVSGALDNYIEATVHLDAGNTAYIDDVYDLTNDRPLQRKSSRYMNSRNPDDVGVPRSWSPAGRDATSAGYLIHPRPGVVADEISIRETAYNYPRELVESTQNPVIPGTWHRAIWLAAVAEAATVIDWPEKAQEYEQLFMTFIAERRSPVEEAGAAGGRRHFTAGGR